MKASQKRNWLQIGGTALGATAGAFAGNPMMGAKLGSGLGTAAGGFVKDDEPLMKTKIVYPELSPASNFAKAPLTNPQSFTYTPQVKNSQFENIMDVAAPLLSSFAPSLMGGGGSPQAGAILPDGGLMAQDGVYLPKTSPSHEQGGVDIEAEGGELILNEEQQAFIDAGTSPEDKAKRYQQVRMALMNKGMQGDKAYNGMYVNPSLLEGLNPDLGNIGMPLQNQHGYQGGSLLSQDFKSGPQNTMANRLMSNTAMGGSVPAHRNLIRNEFGSNKPPSLLEGLNLGVIGGDVKPPVVPEKENPYGFIDDAIAATQQTNNLGAGSDMAKMLINLRGLMSETPSTAPFTAERLQAPTYKSQADEMRGDLDQSVAMGNSLLKDLSHEQRVAGTGNLMQGYQQGMRDISRHQAEVDNMNAGAAAETGNQNIALKSQLEKENYQKTMLENQAEHMRKQIGLSEMMKGIDTMINRDGQSKTNVASLEMLRSMLPNMKSEDMAKIMQMFFTPQ